MYILRNFNKEQGVIIAGKRKVLLTIFQNIKLF